LARAWVRGLPRALMYKSGRPAAGVSSRARAITSAFRTCPGPPPVGVSSRKPRALPECSRMSIVDSRQSPRSRHAVPINETPRGPGKASGNMVRTVASNMAGACSAAGGVLG
jgi:hypothetical protein